MAHKASQLLLQEAHAARNAGRERWGEHTLQKKTVLLIPAHTLSPSPKHRPTCPQCIFTQPLICNPKRTKAAGHSLPSTQPGSSKLPASDPAPPLPCPATPACGCLRLQPDHTHSAVFSRDPPRNLSPSGSSLASTSCSYIQRYPYIHISKWSKPL